MKLTPELIEELVAQPNKIDAGVPTLYEIEQGLRLLRKRHPVDVWYLRRRLKWLARKIDREYDVKWRTPWDK